MDLSNVKFISSPNCCYKEGIFNICQNFLDEINYRNLIDEGYYSVEVRNGEVVSVDSINPFITEKNSSKKYFRMNFCPFCGTKLP